MRHYEIIFLVHPDQSEQVGGMAKFTAWKIGVVVSWLTPSTTSTKLTT